MLIKECILAKHTSGVAHSLWFYCFISYRGELKFTHKLSSALAMTGQENTGSRPHADLHQSDCPALSQLELTEHHNSSLSENIERDWHEWEALVYAHSLHYNCAILFVFVLFLCFSFHSLTECDETGQVWHPKGPKKPRQCSLMGEAAVIHSLWILIKFSLSVSAVFLFPAEMASNHQGSACCIYRHFSIRGIYHRKEVCLHALMCVCAQRC